MTPQPDRIERQKGFVRYSAGGSTSGGGPGAGPRRVKIVEPWKVSDIIVGKKEEEQEQPQMPPATPVKRERLTEQEKQVCASWNSWRVSHG